MFEADLHWSLPETNPMNFERIFDLGRVKSQGDLFS